MADTVGGSEDRDSSLFGDEPRFRRSPDPFAESTDGDDLTVDDSQIRRVVRRLDELSERLDESDRRAASVDERTIAMQSRLEDVARALGLLGRRLQEQAAAPPAPSVDDETGERLAQIERQVRRLPGTDDVASAVSSRVRELLTPVEDRIGLLEGRHERILALVDGVSAALDAEGAALRMDQERLTAILLGVREDLADLPDATGAAAWEEVMARVERAMSAQANRVETVLGRLRESMTESLEAAGVQHETTGQLLANELARTRDLTADRLEVAQRLADVTAEAIANQVRAVEATMLDVADELGQGLSRVVNPLGELERATGELDRSSRDMSETLGAAGERVAAMDGRLAAVEERMAQFEDILRDRVGAAVTDGLSRMEEALAAHREALEQSLGDQADQSLAAAREALMEITDRAGTLADRLEVFEEVLVAVLAEHDQALADQRQQLVFDLVSSLADGLTKRDRRRLAAKIEVPPPPATTDMSRRIREVFELARDRRLPTGRGLEQGSDEATEGPETGSDGARPESQGEDRSGRSGMDSRPPKRVFGKVDRSEEGAEDAPTLADILERVPGLRDGPRAELVSRYASVEDLEAASDDDLLGIRGIGETMLSRIRSATAS